MKIVRQEVLVNGLEITFVDQTNRYFGDYHRVCVVATIRCPVDTIRNETVRAKARELYGDNLDVEKRFEKMGVASEAVDSVRESLVNDFMSHASTYLGRDDYPDLLAAAELKKRRTKRYYA